MKATRLFEVEAFSPRGGSYALILGLADDIFISGPGRRPCTVSSGTYLYAGRAMGPGGLRARLRRHVNPNKKQHWHVDRLTASDTIVAIGMFENISECEIVARAIDRIEARTPIVGFGSSDCRTCTAHLVELSPHQEIEPALTQIGSNAIEFHKI